MKLPKPLLSTHLLWRLLSVSETTKLGSSKNVSLFEPEKSSSHQCLHRRVLIRVLMW